MASHIARSKTKHTRLIQPTCVPIRLKKTRFSFPYPPRSTTPRAVGQANVVFLRCFPTNDGEKVFETMSPQYRPIVPSVSPPEINASFANRKQAHYYTSFPGWKTMTSHDDHVFGRYLFNALIGEHRLGNRLGGTSPWGPRSPKGTPSGST
jgi:hypothetical protein